MTLPISATEWARMLLLYAHLIVSMLAIARVLSADLGLFTGRLSRSALHDTVRDIARLLVALWVTGLAIVWIDTGFEPAALAERSKLLLKLAAVVVLTLNGIALHRASFPVLMSDAPLGAGRANLLAVTGSLSTMHWLLAAFVGVAKPLGKLPPDVLLGSYVALCGATVSVSIACLPLVRQHVLRWRRASDPALRIDHVIR